MAVSGVMHGSDLLIGRMVRLSGEFDRYIKKGGIKEDEARFYTAEMALAISALHEVGIVYHDFKPANCLLTASGHIKIIDFGLASHTKDLKKRAWCKCGSGTPCYMAPELITQQPHDYGVDWWGLGCVLYEMLTGHRPFDSANRGRLCNMICTGKPEYSGGKFNSDSRKVCEGLLDPEPTQRLCYNRGVSELKKQAWFRDLSWSVLEKGQLEAPMAPGNVLDAGDGFMGAMFAASGGIAQDIPPNNAYFGNSTSPGQGAKGKKKSKRNSQPEEFDFRTRHN